jgi:hypothetical protein
LIVSPHLQEVIVRSPPSFLIPAALAVLLGAAAPPPAAAAAPAGGVQQTAAPAAIYVENQTDRSLNIVLEREGMRTVLGRIGQGERRRFDVPTGLLTTSDVRLVALPLGQRSRLESQAFFVSPGDEFGWQIWEAPGSRGSVGWATLSAGAPTDLHRYLSRG